VSMSRADDLAGAAGPGGGLTGGRWRWSTAAALAVALAASVPTAGDLGLTWDEPAYRFSQIRSAQWWGRLAGAVRSGDRAELRAIVEPDALLFYWTYGRHGVNFHPPLAGQLSLLTYGAFGGLAGDTAARRLASVFEFSAAVALAFGFLSRRYGPWVGGVAAGALLLLPRVYGDGHIAGTDTPGLLLWPATALAFWKGLYGPGGGRWRVAVGVLLGLAFVEKMAAVFVLVPLLGWLVVARLPGSFRRPGARADWLDGLATTAALAAPLLVALAEILRLTRRLPMPKMTDLFVDRPYSPLPGVMLAAPLALWLVRRLLKRLRPASPVWGVERPGLETWAAVLAFAPVVGWLGNPAWWRETLPRLAHYYMINTDRRGSLPDIQILYFGQVYEYSLPWHNAWVLIALTVPVMTLTAAAVGLVYAARVAGRDRLPLYFGVHLLTLPAFRMLPTPAHDGVRLFLPTFFFLAAFAGWGTVWAALGLSGRLRGRVAPVWVLGGVSALVLAPSAWQLARVHPFELSYYNEVAGGPRGAWAKGFELTYWYDAFNAETLAEVNARLPRGAEVDFLNDKTNPMTFGELQSLGELRGDVVLGWRDLGRFPHVWLLTQDSKASAFTRLLFAMRPWYERRPRQLDGLRVATVADPAAVSRAWALWLLLDAPDDRPPRRTTAPAWVHGYAPWLGRFWGEGLTEVRRLNCNGGVLRWAREDPEGLRAAARSVVEHRGPAAGDPGAARLWSALSRYPHDRPGAFARVLLRARPEALVEAATILTARPDDLRAVLSRYTYTDGVDLDRGL